MELLLTFLKLALVVVPIIVAVVERLKAVLPQAPSWLLFLSDVALGVVGALFMAQLMVVSGEVAPPAVVVYGAGVLFGLGAAGAYDLSNLLGGTTIVTPQKK